MKLLNVLLTHKQNSVREKENTLCLRVILQNLEEKQGKVSGEAKKKMENLFLEELYLRLKHAFAGRNFGNFLE